MSAITWADDRSIYRHVIESQILPTLLGQAPVFWPGFDKLRMDSSLHSQPRHLERHDEFVEIVHVTQGTGRVYFARDWCIAHMGDTFILPSSIQHDFVTDVSTDYDAFWISCHEDKYALHCQNRKEPGLQQRQHLHLAATASSQQTINNLLSRIQVDSPHLELTIWLLITQFVVDILDLLTPTPNPDGIAMKDEISLTHRLAIQNVLYSLKRDMRDDIDLETLAKRVGFTKNYLCSLFTEVTGESIFSCLRRMRMQRAKELLSRSNMPIQEIAASVGYRNVSSFSRAFHETYHMAPSKMRSAKGPES